MIRLAIVDVPPDTAARTQGGHGLRLIIEDDGVGMDRTLRGPGLGLIGMRERVEAFNGHFSIVSQPGEGTTISVDLPLTSNESGA